jgi:hypothetical protein
MMLVVVSLVYYGVAGSLEFETKLSKLAPTVINLIKKVILKNSDFTIEYIHVPLGASQSASWLESYDAFGKRHAHIFHCTQQRAPFTVETSMDGGI